LERVPRVGARSEEPQGCATAVRGNVAASGSTTDGEVADMPRQYSRLTEPLVREGGALRPASWDEALDRAAAGFEAHRGPAYGMFSCSKSSNEVNYLAQKFTRSVMGSNNIDSCNRT
jgi:anaerobic selenocysteine-containing dehydrogenase